MSELIRAAIQEKTRKVLGCSVLKSSASIDLPRLSSRLSITNEGVTTDYSSISDSKERLTSFLSDLVRILENEKVLNRVKECYSNSNEVTLVENVLKIVEDCSDSARVINSIHQDIVAEPATLVKTAIFTATNSLTRDDNSQSGWLINVSFTPNVVTVCHSRRELSMSRDPKFEITEIEIGVENQQKRDELMTIISSI